MYRRFGTTMALNNDPRDFPFRSADLSERDASVDRNFAPPHITTSDFPDESHFDFDTAGPTRAGRIVKWQPHFIAIDGLTGEVARRAMRHDASRQSRRA
jgi:hypothetical protein